MRLAFRPAVAADYPFAAIFKDITGLRPFAKKSGRSGG
jgi:hypothetical protein